MKITRNQTNSAIVQKRSKGFISVELGLVLLVIAIAIIGSVIAYTKNLKSTSINTNVSQLNTIIGAAKAKYGQANQYAAVTTDIAVRGHIINDELRDGPGLGTATNSFGGPIVVAVATLTAANDALQVTWPNVDSAQCSDIVNGVVGGVRRLQVAGVDVKATDVAVNNAALVAQCDSAANVNIDIFIGKS